jgi:hypothetical protein
VGGFFHVYILAPLLGGITAAVSFVRVLEPLMKHGPGDCCGGPKKPVHFNNLETPVTPRKVLAGLGDIGHTADTFSERRWRFFEKCG